MMAEMIESILPPELVEAARKAIEANRAAVVVSRWQKAARADWSQRR